MASPALFHLSFPVSDLEATERWYVDGLGCLRGRRSQEAMVLGLGGHQLVAHLERDPGPIQRGLYPRHFGLVFTEPADFEAIEQRAKQQELRFGVACRLRYPDSPLEHRSFFLIDPSANWLEFKHYRHPEAVLGLGELTLVGERTDPSLLP
ncbi:glyoxalase [Synechococcus sp. Tobar12-5m-g]|uniref:VOC family protein n=1 Tax=unclassified Synechococcus TaxID=2626047 RepID=UPI0020CDADFF|nr:MULTISPECIES: VOC family protein [unclassified Synechococcus]MCP9773081.1 glyoxalase [Synechococcus sp. Tobar12-5m-g]MCP9873919.1 glyoxalase [Synechococcus sp. Cruz CV-v-12]